MDDDEELARLLQDQFDQVTLFFFDNLWVLSKGCGVATVL
jgi:hypothetical protein